MIILNVRDLNAKQEPANSFIVIWTAVARHFGIAAPNTCRKTESAASDEIKTYAQRYISKQLPCRHWKLLLL